MPTQGVLYPKPQAKVKVYWLDDEPRTVQKLKQALQANGIEVQLFEDSGSAFDAVKQAVIRGGASVFPVGIADLWLPGEPGEDGAQFAQRVRRLHAQHGNPPARVGFITAHRDMFSDQEIESSQFVFGYRKRHLRRENHYSLVEDLRRNAALFLADKAAIEYDEKNPVQKKKSYLKDHRLKSTLFGYVRKIEGRDVWVTLWDPRTLHSEFTRVFDRDLLAKRKVTDVGHSFRMCVLEKKREGDIVHTIEAVEKGKPKGWQALREGFDYGRFRREK